MKLWSVHIKNWQCLKQKLHRYADKHGVHVSLTLKLKVWKFYFINYTPQHSFSHVPGGHF